MEKCNRNWIQYQGHFKDLVEFGVDDTHSPEMIGKNWIEIETDSFDKETILEKLKSGDFTIVSRWYLCLSVHIGYVGGVVTRTNMLLLDVKNVEDLESGHRGTLKRLYKNC